MKTWRERITEGGKSTSEDRRRAFDLETCGVGQTAALYGVDRGKLVRACGSLQGSNVYLGSRFLTAVTMSRWGDAGQILDQIEDLALALKREQA